MKKEIEDVTIDKLDSVCKNEIYFVKTTKK